MKISGVWRAFLAVPLDVRAATAVAAEARRVVDGGAFVGRWRVLPPGHLHLTLRFFGDVPARTRPAVLRLPAVLAAAVPPGEATTGTAIPLPGPRRPRVLAFEVSDPADTLRRLAAAAEAAAVSLGFPPEERPFLPHVTVARLDRHARGRAAGVTGPASRVRGPAVARAAATPAAAGRAPVPIAIRDVELVRSILGPGGPRYDVLAAAPLAGGPEQVRATGGGDASLAATTPGPAT